MARPSTDPILFATDATFTAPGEDWDGDANKVEPSAYHASGFLPDLELPAEYVNYKLAELSEWADFLRQYDDALDFDGTNTFAGTPDFSAGVTFSGNPAFSGNPSFTGDPVFTGVPAITNGASLNGTVAGNPTFSGNPLFTGTPEFDDVTLDGIVTPTSSGRIRKRVATYTADTNQNISVSSADVHIQEDTHLSTDGRAWVLNTGTGDGDTMKMVNLDENYYINVQPISGMSGGIDIKNGTGYPTAIEVTWSNSVGSWVLSGSSYTN